MTADALRTLLLPLILAIGAMRLRDDRPATSVRLLRAELALTVLVLLPALLSSAAGARRTAFAAAILAVAVAAGTLPRLFGDAPTDPASDAPAASASRGLLPIAAALLLTGWCFASIHADEVLIPRVVERREIALALSVLLVSAFGFVRAGDPWTVLCRLASLGNAVLVLASVVPDSPAPAVVASLALVPVTLLAAVLLPRLRIAAAGEGGPRGR